MDKNNKPNFIGIGGQKCATTWMSECLRRHPQIFMSSPKELHFFSNNWEKGVNWYFNYFKNAGKYRVRGEFSTSYLYDSMAPERIKKILGNIKLIAIIRNPVQRFISLYKHYLREKKYFTKNFKKLTIKNFNKAIELHPDLLTKGKYYIHLTRYQNIFGKENIKIILKEEIDKNPRKIIRETYKFLNVDPNFLPDIINRKVSPGIIPKIKFLETIRKNMYMIAKKTDPKIIDLIRRTGLAELYRKLNNGSNSLKIEKPVITKLNNYYKDEIKNIERLLNRDLTIWKK